MEKNGIDRVLQCQDISRPKESLCVMGIDLGTTNSSVSVARWETTGTGEAEPVEIPQSTMEGHYTHLLLPSVVALHEGELFVGEGAKRLRCRAHEMGLRLHQNLFYECKNEIGLRKTYHRAPEGFNSAAHIGGQVLNVLAKAANEALGRQPNRVVVTVPASFQAAQRQDTIRAAELAGLTLGSGDLLDEPVAAFLDYLISNGQELVTRLTQPRTLVVFDFGGGTCDVAVFRLQQAENGLGILNVSPLSVSRYHRLGGGDIDAAIVHDVLIPALCQQNEIKFSDLTFEDKKVHLEPALLGLAEMLKVGLSIEIRRQMSFGRYTSIDPSTVVKTQPGVHHCQLGQRQLKLTSPKLTAAQFETVLKPFLDRDFLYARETEYRQTCSIFAPLQDALDRGGITAEQVDFCLTVGGSSLIPQIFEGIKAFFAKAQVLTYTDRDTVKTCVSRGAAYHALALAAFGRGLVQPVCHDEIAVQSEAGPVSLVPKGVGLPYPSDGSWASNTSLAVPEKILKDDYELRVEIIAMGDRRRLFSTVWRIPAPVNQGCPIHMEYRYDENQILHLRAHLAESHGQAVLEETIENPLTNVVNPQPKRIIIEEMEEKLRCGKVPKESIPKAMSELAELYVELGQREKGIEFMQRAMRANGSPDVSMLNTLATFYRDAGDWDREEKCYKEATRVSSWGGSWFNYALALKRRGRLADAAEALEHALSHDRDGPFLVLGAILADALKKTTYEQQLMKEALASFGSISQQSDWELGWFITGLARQGESPILVKAKAEQRRRSQSGQTVRDEVGHLPMITPAMIRREL